LFYLNNLHNSLQKEIKAIQSILTVIALLGGSKKERSNQREFSTNPTEKNEDN